MCGITGYLSNNNSISKDDLIAMTCQVSHRGPDAEGYFSDDLVGLGHRRLSILDLSSSANQPMVSACGNYIIVYNGEIYNYKELALKYNLKLKTTGDTEAILEAFVKKGPEVFQEYNGMFALAIYDKQKRKLYITRDRIGIKPLFYFWDGTNFIFSSELKSIARLKKISLGGINKSAVSDFLYLGFIPEPDTIYNNVKKFPTGHYAEVDASNFTLKEYWSLTDQISNEIISDFNEAKAELKNLIESSVQYRLISDVPYGIFLSGGIDSSLLTAVSSKVSKETVKTFSIGFKENKFNELEYARQVASYFKTEHHEFVVTYKDAYELIPQLIDLYDEPFSDSSSIPTLLVSKLAKQYVTMTFSGDGGDELFYGYGAYNWAKRLNNPFYKSLKLPLKVLLSLGNSRYQRASHMFNDVSAKRIKSHIFSQEQYLFSEKELADLITPEYNVSFGFDEDFPGLKRKLQPEEEQALFDVKFYLKDDLLVKVDRATMWHGVETRVPLLDHRIVGYALNLDPKLKLNGKDTKYILKQILYDYMPESFFNRPKWGFAIPLKDWLKNELSYLIDEYCSKSVIEEFNVVNYKKVSQLVSEFRNGKDYLFNRIWLIILLHDWLKKNKQLNNIQ